METVEQTVPGVDHIRDLLAGLVGSRMRLKANMGRSKVLEREGVLEKCHAKTFNVAVTEKRDRTTSVSYSFVDVLTRTVELTHPDTGENVLPWLN